MFNLLGRRTLPPFPPSFRFGVATADHQCEAFVPGLEDIRDEWESVRGQTVRGRATDFWARYAEDVELAAGMGCTAFRLSLAWSRLEPQPGAWDAPAFEHYRAVLGTIRAHGMVSIVTLHHNTWPLHVQRLDGGAGMRGPSFPDRFAEYAREVATRLGALVDYYVTLNEPNQLVYGFIKPWWMRAYPMPPGLDRFATSAQQIEAVAELIPNLFRAHARARNAVREVVPNALVGTNPLVFGFPRWLTWLLNRNAKRTNRKNLLRQGERIGKRALLELGRAHVAIAQLTLAPERMDDTMFSEAYFIAHFAMLGGPALPSLDALASWHGRVAVAQKTTGPDDVQHYFPNAAIGAYAGLQAAVDAVRSGRADAVFGDDVTLRPYVRDGLALRVFPKSDQPYAAGVAPGNRTLLNAVDMAIRDFKKADASGTSPWQRAVAAAFPGEPLPDRPIAARRATLAALGASGDDAARARAPQVVDVFARIEVPPLDDSLERVRRGGVLRVGINPGVAGLCTAGPGGAYAGIEPELARYVAARIFGQANGRVELMPLPVSRRIAATRSWLQVFDPILRAYAILSTIIAANWWNLGMAGELDESLCPREAVNALDYVGIDYYWGIDGVSYNRFTHLLAASESRYASAPVWPEVLYDIVREAHQQFAQLPVVVIENGCVSAADGFSRETYIARHVAEVQRAVADGIPVAAYVCWSITSNREWGLAFDQNSDFGLYHIELDGNPGLKRLHTPAVAAYAAIIKARSAVP